MSNGHTPNYQRGNYLMECEICLIWIRRNVAMQNYKKQWTCKGCFDEKHPQEFRTPRIKDGRSVKPARPPGPQNFTTVPTPGYPIDPFPEL